MSITRGDKKRFWDKVDTAGSCWEWAGCIDKDGYGKFSVGYKSIVAHRFAYSLVSGLIPEGMCVCHHCDNPGCVKPSHLFLGTDADNHKDSVAKGRRARGETCGKSKLCENDVHEIRRLRSLGLKPSLLGKMWRVTLQNVIFIVNRETWKHIR